MNKIFGVLFCIISTILLSSGASAAEGHGGWHERHANDQRDTIADMRLKKAERPSLKTYIPSDLKGEDGVAKLCDDRGNTLSEDEYRHAKGQCHVYRSASTGTSWKILYVGSGNVSQVFKIQRGKNVPWVFFDDHDLLATTYVSPGAQKFASTKSSDDTEVAGSTDPTKSVEEQTPEINAPDILKKGLGAIFEKRRFGF